MLCGPKFLWYFIPEIIFCFQLFAAYKNHVPYSSIYNIHDINMNLNVEEESDMAQLCQKITLLLLLEVLGCRIYSKPIIVLGHTFRWHQRCDKWPSSDPSHWFFKLWFHNNNFLIVGNRKLKIRKWLFFCILNNVTSWDVIFLAITSKRKKI